MNIIGGAWRGRRLAAPPGATTRPTAGRLRQALFDMLLHASWGGRQLIEAASVLDVFAGTGALGLEALSRGAAQAVFIERDRAALAALRTNIAACGTHATRVEAVDATLPLPGDAATLVFLDPPYNHDLVARAWYALRARDRIAPSAIAIAETGRFEALPDIGVEWLAERTHGAARLLIFRAPTRS